jgi:hypothetical protein
MWLLDVGLFLFVLAISKDFKMAVAALILSWVFEAIMKRLKRR